MSLRRIALVLRPFGLGGALIVWLVVEAVQVIYILRLNARLFPREFSISTVHVRRLIIVLTGAFSAAAWPCWESVYRPLTTVVFVATAFGAFLGIVDYFLFDLQDVQQIIQDRRRLATVR